MLRTRNAWSLDMFWVLYICIYIIRCLEHNSHREIQLTVCASDILVSRSMVMLHRSSNKAWAILHNLFSVFDWIVTHVSPEVTRRCFYLWQPIGTHRFEEFWTSQIVCSNCIDLISEHPETLMAGAHPFLRAWIRLCWSYSFYSRGCELFRPETVRACAGGLQAYL